MHNKSYDYGMLKLDGQVVYDGDKNFFTSGYVGFNARNLNVEFTNIKFTDDTDTTE